MNPLQYAVYKGTGGKFGAAQFNFQPPHFYNDRQKDYTGREAFEEVDGKRKLKDGWKTRDGCVFFEAAPTVDKNKYDWKQKVIMALSVNDLSKILYFLTTSKSPNSKEDAGTMSLMHDPHAKSNKQGEVRKYLKFYSPKGTANGLLLTAEHVEGDDKRSHKIPISGDEVMALRVLLTQAISRALNW